MTASPAIDSYWLECLSVEPDGAIVLGVAGMGPVAPWKRTCVIPAGAPDHGFWSWLVDCRRPLPGTFSDELLAKYRDEYREII